jgi:hypothetical protein
MCHYLGAGLHGKQKRVKAQSESSKSVVNSVLISREMPVFPGFLEIIRVVMKKIKHSTTFSFHREKTDTKTELLLSLTTSSTSKSTFDSSNMSAIPKIGKQLISFILTNYNKILPFCSTIQDSLLIDLVIFLLIENFL